MRRGPRPANRTGGRAGRGASAARPGRGRPRQSPQVFPRSRRGAGRAISANSDREGRRGQPPPLARSEFARERCEVVAAHLARDLRRPAVDLRRVLAHGGIGRSVGISLARAQFQLALVVARRQRAEARPRSVGEDGRQRADVIDRLSVDDAPRPAELLPIMPPSVARLAVATSGPNARPNRASSALR